MANEATVAASLTFAKGNFASLARAFSGLARDVSGSPLPILRTQMIGIVEEALDLDDVGTAGYCLLKNTDSTNFVLIRGASGQTALVKLKAGDIALFRLATSTPYAIADTAGCILEMYIIPD